MAACSLTLGLWLVLLLQDTQTAPQVSQQGIKILQPLRTQEPGEVWGHPGLQGYSAHRLGAG